MELKVTGIYDRKTLKTLQSLGIYKLGFDFRPKSFNFLQQYLFLEIMRSSYMPSAKYYFHYQNEADYIVKKMVDDLKAEIETDNNIILEFSDIQKVEYYDQFEIPYCWHFQDFESLEDVIKGRNLKEVAVGFSLIEHLNRSGTLNEFSSVLSKLMLSRGIELVLDLDWDSDLFPSLSEFLNLSSYSFSINQKTEISYRNVDMIAVKKVLQQFK